mmetsp:Transcript_10221/g.32238  ORF Transcript_10221/g.32238 Transcript_10221/m.32238 type:complete len:289 (+) Transcript_10221:54-920(+)
MKTLRRAQPASQAVAPTKARSTSGAGCHASNAAPIASITSGAVIERLCARYASRAKRRVSRHAPYAASAAGFTPASRAIVATPSAWAHASHVAIAPESTSPCPPERLGAPGSLTSSALSPSWSTSVPPFATRTTLEPSDSQIWRARHSTADVLASSASARREAAGTSLSYRRASSARLGVSTKTARSPRSTPGSSITMRSPSASITVGRPCAAAARSTCALAASRAGSRLRPGPTMSASSARNHLITPSADARATSSSLAPSAHAPVWTSCGGCAPPRSTGWTMISGE